MLSILLLFFIGKYFYELAQDYYKHRWLFAILGIVVYYIGTIIFGFILALLILLFDFNIDIYDSFGWNLLAIPFGLALDYVFYIFLERKWKKEAAAPADEIQDIGKRSED